jgi:hypothetical protein
VFVSGHRKNDLFSLRLHEAIAANLQADPDKVLRKAQENLAALRGRPNES